MRCALVTFLKEDEVHWKEIAFVRMRRKARTHVCVSVHFFAHTWIDLF